MATGDLAAAGQAGAKWAGMEILRLPLTVADVFRGWLDQNEAGKKEKVPSEFLTVLKSTN